jgi:hypothetical protein
MNIRRRPIRWLIWWQIEPLGGSLARDGYDPRLKEVLRRRRIATKILFRRMIAAGAAIHRPDKGKFGSRGMIGLDVRIERTLTRWQPSAELWRSKKETISVPFCAHQMALFPEAGQ